MITPIAKFSQSQKPNFETVSLYVHIPFCRRKCGYCHFYVLPDREALKEELLKALLLECQRQLPLLADRQLISIYFGGGTPTLFGAKRLDMLLQSILRSTWPIQDVEITIEGNPEDITEEKMRVCRALGINRISIGVQALDDAQLATLTRLHNAKQAVSAVYAASCAGIRNISIDLMYELPNQTLRSWQNTLKQAVELPITHLSLYNLTIEPHTGFAQKRAYLQAQLPSEEQSRAMYLSAAQILTEAGFVQYEISAFAKGNYASHHNSGYWQARPFIGLGPSAFSYWQGKRYRNEANLRRYAEALSAGKSPVDFEETLSPSAAEKECFVLALRLLTGACLKDYPLLEEKTHHTLYALQEQGLLEVAKQRWRLTEKGRLFYDFVASALI